MILDENHKSLEYQNRAADELTRPLYHDLDRIAVLAASFMLIKDWMWWIMASSNGISPSTLLILLPSSSFFISQETSRSRCRENVHSRMWIRKTAKIKYERRDFTWIYSKSFVEEFRQTGDVRSSCLLLHHHHRKVNSQTTETSNPTRPQQQNS